MTTAGTKDLRLESTGRPWPLVHLPLGPTNKGHMKGDDYLNHFLLPNFHFHVTAAYAILRHYGVDIKRLFWCDPHEDDLSAGEASILFYRLERRASEHL